MVKFNKIMKQFTKAKTQLEKLIDSNNVKMETNDRAIDSLVSESTELSKETHKAAKAIGQIDLLIGE